jgi:hypothetical protein
LETITSKGSGNFKENTMHTLFGALAGLAVGVFCPAIARKLKALFVKDATAIQTAATSAVAKKL